MDYNFTTKNSQIFECKKCNFKCSKKGDLERHLQTQKHKRTTLDYAKSAPHQCRCGKIYKHRQGLWKHSKKCNMAIIEEEKEEKVKEESQSVDDLSREDYKSLINLLINDNKELRNFIVENNKEMTNIIKEQNNDVNKGLLKETNEIMNKVLEINSSPKIINNTINGNVINNRFNINMFLNNECKDAINFSEFIDRIEVSHADLENNAELGFVNGMSKILLDNLKQLSVYERPIHCTDLKRETMYIKDEDRWQKEEDNKKLSNAIQEVSRKSISKLNDWKVENPDYNDMNSDFSNKCLTIQKESNVGSDRETFYPKVVKTIAKESVINKNSIEN